MTRVFDIATLGTSLTSGTVTSRSYHLDLRRALAVGKKSIIRTYNFGIGGGYTTDGLARVPDVIRLRPKAVTVEYTMNDCLIPLGVAQANTIAMLDQLKAGLPDSFIFLLILNKVVGSGQSAIIRSGVNTYNDMYRALSVSQNVGLIDTWPQWANATLTDITDGVHATTEANLQYAIPTMAMKLAPLID